MKLFSKKTNSKSLLSNGFIISQTLIRYIFKPLYKRWRKMGLKESNALLINAFLSSPLIYPFIFITPFIAAVMLYIFCSLILFIACSVSHATNTIIRLEKRLYNYHLKLVHKYFNDESKKLVKTRTDN